MSQASAPIRHADRFYIGGQWVAPSSDATIRVIDSDTEELFFTVPEAQAADISRAVDAARDAFDNGPWPWLTHAQRAEYLRAIGAELSRRSEELGQIWPRESGVLHVVARGGGRGAEATFSAFAALAETFPFEEPAKPSAGQFGLAGGARGGVPDRRGRRGRRPATRRPQRRHRRPRSLRTPGPRPPRRQDHLHRLHRRRTPHRLPMRRAHRPLHPRTRRHISRRHPRRRGHRDHRRLARAGRVPAVRPGLRVADQDRGHPAAPR